MKLFIFESHPIQYYAPVYRELHSICSRREGNSIHVFYATDASLRGHFDPGFKTRIAWDEDLLDGYQVSVLNAVRGEPMKSFWSLTGNGIWNLLASARPDAVLVTNFLYQFDWTVIASAAILRIPIWFRADTQDQAFARGPLKKVLRHCFYRVLYSRFDRAVVRGKLNSQHFANHGIPPERQILSPHCVVDRFAELSAEEKLNLRQEVRRKLGISDKAELLLFCGKLQQKKNPLILVQALAQMSQAERQKYALLFVGTGELEADLRAQAAKIPALTAILAGFKNQKELPKFYLAADTLVLPSLQMGETWGLVVNEALLAERRVILSRHVGCHADFSCLPSVRIFDGTIEGLTEALRAGWVGTEVSGQREFMRLYSVRIAAERIAAAMDIIGGADPCHVELEAVQSNSTGSRVTVADTSDKGLMAARRNLLQLPPERAQQPLMRRYSVPAGCRVAANEFPRWAPENPVSLEKIL